MFYWTRSFSRLLLCSQLVASMALGETVRMEVGEINVRVQSSNSTSLYLKALKTLPPGTIVEFESADYYKPVHIRYRSGSRLQTSKYGFVKNIRIVSIPGAPQSSVDSLNRNRLHMSVAELSTSKRLPLNSSPRAIQVRATPPVPGVSRDEDSVQRRRVHQPSSAYSIQTRADNGQRHQAATSVDSQRRSPIKDTRARVVPEVAAIKAKHFLETASGSTSPTSCVDCTRSQQNIAPAPRPHHPNKEKDRVRSYCRQLPAPRTTPLPSRTIETFSRMAKKAVGSYGLSPQAAANMKDFLKTRGQHITNDKTITIVDFTQASNSRRMYVFHLDTGVIERVPVAHGRGSQREGGHVVPTRFSNATNETHASSTGFYLTFDGTYNGKNGNSMRLHGLDASNNAACIRDIVVHGAPYVSNKNGTAGRSHGCFAVDINYQKQFIRATKGGSIIYAYGQQNQSRGPKIRNT